MSRHNKTYRVVGYRKPLYSLENEQSGLDAIYTNGSNNLYPYYVRNSVDGSATASMAHDRHKQYIAGKLDSDDIIVNEKKELFLSDIIDDSANDLSIQNGFFVHVNYSIDLELKTVQPIRPSVIPYENCRISKEDEVGS